MIELLREFGPAITAIGFFIWRDWKREEAVTKRNDELNDFIRTKLNDTLKETIEAVSAMVAHCKGTKA